MKSILILIIYTLANIGCSYSVLSIFSRNLRKNLPLCIIFALGTALLSTLWTFIGLAGVMNREIISPIVFIMAIVSIPYLYRQSCTSTFSLRILLEEAHKNRTYPLLLLLAIGVALWIGVLAYILPPGGDSTAFYMAYPKIISTTSQLASMPGLFHDFSSIGISGELHYAVLMKLGNPAIAKLFAWIVGINILFVLRRLIAQVGGGLIAQIVAIIMLLTSSTYCNFLFDGKTDSFSVLLGLASIFCIVLLREKQFTRSLTFIAGLLMGFSMSAKFSFIIALFPAGVFLLLFQEITLNRELKKSNPIQQSVYTLVLFGAGIFIAILPHLLKNWILFDNPFVPFIGMANWANQSNWYSFKDTLWLAATYPLALVFGVYPLMGGSMSVLWIAAFVFILFLPRAKLSLRQPVIQIMLSGCVGLLCWIMIKASIFVPRYFLATLIMLIPLPAIAVEYTWQTEIRPRLISMTYAMLACGILCLTPFLSSTGEWNRVAIHHMKHPENFTQGCNMEIQSDYCKGFLSLNKKVAQGERVYVMGYYTYWLREDLLQCIAHTNELNIQELPNSKFWEALYQSGFTYLAIQKESHGSFLSKYDPAGAPKWLKVSQDFTDTGMPIFHLKARKAAKQPEIACVKEINASWHPKKRSDS